MVWITPFYPSPGFDAGYDVADYVDVDPAFGDLAAFQRMLDRAHELGLRVLVDLVPNHSSSAHPWFLASRSHRDSPYRNWYVWRDSLNDGPPNNWLSVFGGPAWTFDEATRQWWLHLFLPEQPDLNWAEPAVVEAFDDILGFWMQRGVDGFRIDVAHGLAKHPELPDLPPATASSRRSIGTSTAYASLDHIHDHDQDAVLDVYRRWRRVIVAEADSQQVSTDSVPQVPVLVGEVYLPDPDRVARYVRENDGLHASFWFPLQEAGWDAEQLREAIADGLVAGAVGDRPSTAIVWAIDSHDQDRSASRFGGGVIGRRRSLSMTALIMGLPGVPFIYQGQELGLTDGVVPRDRVQDPIALRLGEIERGRDPARTPMPWRPGEGMGFCPADVEPWLPFGGHQDDDTVAVQRDDPASWLHAVRDLIRLRRSHLRPSSAIEPNAFQWLESGDAMLAYRHGDVVAASNCGGQVGEVRLPASTADHDGSGHLTWELLWSTPGTTARVTGKHVTLDPDGAALLVCQT